MAPKKLAYTAERYDDVVLLQQRDVCVTKDAPDLETMVGAMEQNELAQQGIEAESRFLGRLHYRLDYEFSATQVQYSAPYECSLTFPSSYK